MLFVYLGIGILAYHLKFTNFLFQAFLYERIRRRTLDAAHTQQKTTFEVTL